MIEELAHNYLKMKEKPLLIYEKKRENFSILPLCGVRGIPVEHLVPFLVFLDSLSID
jgi:hypothetical protein